MAPLLQRSPQTTSTTPSDSDSDQSQNSWLTSQQSQSQPQPPQEPTQLSLNNILAIVAGILLALFLVIVIFAIARKRQREARNPKPKSLAQRNFFEKLASDQRDMEESSDRRDTWRRDTILYAAETGLERRKVMAEPEKVWVITPLAPVLVKSHPPQHFLTKSGLIAEPEPRDKGSIGNSSIWRWKVKAERYAKEEGQGQRSRLTATQNHPKVDSVLAFFSGLVVSLSRVPQVAHHDLTVGLAGAVSRVHGELVEGLLQQPAVVEGEVGRGHHGLDGFVRAQDHGSVHARHPLAAPYDAAEGWCPATRGQCRARAPSAASPEMRVKMAVRQALFSCRWRCAGNP
ncbi:hypothetical protein B0T16DRAFT_393737 [Cercophora newfieldiana]|uniref:Uncharacterized protein n=1 Tax=Cercophora newfieldiana TaxID=92897 RepID=A0AA40CL49_9PEZI|nr:hypothetical protein B0T16DRAFT_393737 [Cercophora newfieldiana]